jgi:predicted TIM-barrel fold metal-dependent hydrolase
MNRRQFLTAMAALGLSTAAYAGFKLWPTSGFTNPCFTGIPEALRHHPLMQQLWAGMDATNIWDCHLHLVGTGDGQQGAWFNPKMNSILHPILKTQKHFYMNGLCADPANIDNSAVTRLIGLHTEMPQGYKGMLLAFDWFRDEQGRILKEKSIFHVSNEYAAQLASEHSQHFEWIASIHPYSADAIDVLAQVKAQGARAIKWLPSGMGIDPASPKCDRFYKKCAELKLPIITHAGHESAVQGGNQDYGNPLRLRNALDQGVKVIVAHCASEGDDEDLDHSKQRVKSLTLFARLMDTPDYKTLVYGEISALTLINHAWAIKQILARTDWHDRLLNGSDYPLPGIYPLINTTQLSEMGLLDPEHLPFLTQLKPYNALMYDFAIKRLLQFNGVRFSNSVFETRRIFDV